MGLGKMPELGLNLDGICLDIQKIWRLPEMAVPPVIHFRLGFSSINHPFFGYPHFLKSPHLCISHYEPL